MSRRYWAGLMFVSLLVTVFAGYFVAVKLEEKATVDVPLTATAEVPPPATDSARAEPPAGSESPAAEPPAPPETMKTAAQPPAGGETLRNILFSYRSSAAKQVFIVGDFNNWFREPMKKRKDNTWMTTLKMAPGTYKYMYVVDDKRVRDPNNRNVSDDGRSILTVKPASNR